MIKVFYKHFCLIIKGHEQADTSIKLVCCAVSAISNSFINTFKKNEVDFLSKKGFLKVRLLNYSYKNQIKWEMFIMQLYAIYKEYKKIISWKGKRLWKIY